MDTRKLLDFVNNYLFGEKELNELDIEFQLALEDKIQNLKIGEALCWYCDYHSTGNLFEFWKTFEREGEFGRQYPNCGVRNKSGINISNQNGRIYVKTKTGYGANWLVIHN